MSLREAVGPYAHQKQISNKFSRKVSAILIASHCTCKHFLNTMTFLLLFLYKVTLGRVIYDREFIVKAEKKKSHWRRKAFSMQCFKHGGGCSDPAWNPRELVLSTLLMASVSNWCEEQSHAGQWIPRQQQTLGCHDNHGARAMGSGHFHTLHGCWVCG